MMLTVPNYGLCNFIRFRSRIIRVTILKLATIEGSSDASMWLCTISDIGHKKLPLQLRRGSLFKEFIQLESTISWRAG